MVTALESGTVEPSLQALVETAVEVAQRHHPRQGTRRSGSALACLLARGHLLIEDIPGVGKTTLAHALARVARALATSASSSPATCCRPTSSASPSSTRDTRPVPVPSRARCSRSCVLADEVNRATPKAQSALLEAMEEHQVTVDGQTYPLPEPFFVIATQNPRTRSAPSRCRNRSSTGS